MIDVFNLKRFSNDLVIDETMRAERLISPLAVDNDRRIFLCDDQTMGFVFECQPLSGGSKKEKDKIDLMLNQTYPTGTTLSLMLFRSPDIEMQLRDAAVMREGKSRSLLQNIFSERIDFLRRYSREPIITESLAGSIHNIGRIVDTKLIISVKIPISASEPTTDDMQTVVEWSTKTQSVLKSIGFAPVMMNAEHYLRVMNSLINWSDKAAWRNPMFRLWDSDKPIAAQVFDPDSALILASPDTIQLGDDCFVRVLSAKRMPERCYFTSAIGYAGDISGLGQSITQNYAVVCNVYYPDIEKTNAALEKKRQFAAHQAFGPMLKFDPILGSIKHSFDIIYDSQKSGARPIRVSYSLCLFAKTMKELTDASTAAQSQWTTMSFSMKEDKYVMLPMFKNILPLCCDAKAISELWRYKTMTSREASALIPIFGESKGTGKQHVQLISRTGQLMSLSLHDSNTNQNCVIAAESGSGKSFLLNEIILSYMSEGAQVWVIDAGKSYKKLCELLKGDFVEFGDRSNISLNPFECVVKWEDEEDAVVNLVSRMASLGGNLDDFQMAALKTIMRSLWTRTYAQGEAMVRPKLDELERIYGERRTAINNAGLSPLEIQAKLEELDADYDIDRMQIMPPSSMSIDMIVEELMKSNDNRIKDIGFQLESFSSRSAYGRFFAGHNNAKFTNDFTVLELDELQGRKHLRQVVLLQLISQIQREVFLGERNRKKILVIDEAWDLLKEGEVANFMEHAYRKFRKYGGSAVIATQSVQDLYVNTVGQAIAANSATMLLLGQKENTINELAEEKKLPLDEWGIMMLKGVRTEAGVFSEIFVIQNSFNAIGRLVVSDFQKLLYSTTPADVNAIDSQRKKGLTVVEAIKEVLRERGKLPPL